MNISYMRILPFRFFILGILSGGLILLGGLLFLDRRAHEPVSPHTGQREIVIVEEGKGAQGIASLLAQKGIIGDELSFLYASWQTDSTGRLQAGSYVLGPSMSPWEIVELMAKGRVQASALRITIPEGYRAKGIAERIQQNGAEAGGTFLATFSDLRASHAYELFGASFLKEIPQDTSLEGYLFPDTYQIDQADSPEQIIGKMLGAFERKVMPSWRMAHGASSSEANATSSYAAHHTLHEIIILASILEKEVQTPEDMRQAAGVLVKRLSGGMPLQTDATLAYITGKQTSELSNEDKKRQSPYNTYLVKGLPPGPICNPGLNAIEAALHPADNDYWYYLSAPDGTTIFSKTLDEHNANKAKYLR